MKPSRQLVFPVQVALGVLAIVVLSSCSTNVAPENSGRSGPPVDAGDSQLPLPAVSASVAPVEPPDAGPPPAEPPVAEGELAEQGIQVQLQSDPSTRRSLSWKFATGNVFRFQTDVFQRLDESAEPAQNQRSYWFRWEVIDVALDGATTIAVLVERVSLKLKQPEIVYDSADRHSLYRPLADPAAAEELVKVLALLEAQVLIEVNRQGDLVRSVGPPLGNTSYRFVPTDFPILSAVPVGPLDSWQPSSRRPDETAKCIFRKEQVSGNRTIALLECGPASAATESASERIVHTTARFDVNAGRFISRIASGPNWEVRQQLLSSKSTAAYTRFRLNEPQER
jgi:hypothetical protein